MVFDKTLNYQHVIFSCAGAEITKLSVLGLWNKNWFYEKIAR